jgi:hypothetical protein
VIIEGNVNFHGVTFRSGAGANVTTSPRGPMNAILFGAGASYGSELDTKTCPPVMDKLFTSLAHSFPDVWGKLPAPYPQQFTDNFEEAMAKLGEDTRDPLARTAAHDYRPVPADLTAPLQRAMAEYFLQFAPSPGSLYVRLAYRILRKGWLGALITLNYERLLEQALAIAPVPSVCILTGDNTTGLPEICFLMDAVICL